jgi:Double zinc ribbon
MRCPLCQHENREAARFCAACGSSLASKCPACGSQPPPGAAFCDHWAPGGGVRAAGGGDQRKYPHGRAARSGLPGRMAQRGVSSGGTPRGGLAACAPGARLGPTAEGTRGRDARTAPTWHRPCPRRPPDIAHAEARYQQALALADELGMLPLQAHGHRGLGTLYAKISRPDPPVLSGPLLLRGIAIWR